MVLYAAVVVTGCTPRIKVTQSLYFCPNAACGGRPRLSRREFIVEDEHPDFPSQAFGRATQSCQYAPASPPWLSLQHTLLRGQFAPCTPENRTWRHIERGEIKGDGVAGCAKDFHEATRKP